MKKIVLMFIVSLCVVAFVNAQNAELKSKNGAVILPKAGDFAIGINTAPVLNYVGNLLNGCPANAAPTFNFITANTLYAKYFLKDNTAVRVSLRLGMNSTKCKSYVQDDVAVAATPTSDATVTDEQTVATNNITIGAGLEKRRGTGRLQGFYGAGVNVMLTGGTTKYTYGNALTATNTTPTTTTTFTPGAIVAGPMVASRDLEVKNGSGFGFGLRGFAGVEYFVAPKLSIGGEFGWGVALNSTGDGEAKTEALNLAGTAAEETTVKVAGNSTFNLDTDNFGGCIYLLFHF